MPRVENPTRSRAHRRRGAAPVTLALLLAMGGCGGEDAPGSTAPEMPTAGTSSGAEGPSVELGAPEDYARALVEETNIARTADGLPALAAASCAQEQGVVRAQAIADSGSDELVHAPLGPVSAACAPASTAGENLARARVSPAEVVAAWMESPGHRENILTPEFTEMGIGCVLTDDEQMLCSQVFVGQIS